MVGQNVGMLPGPVIFGTLIESGHVGGGWAAGRLAGESAIRPARLLGIEASAGPLY